MVLGLYVAEKSIPYGVEHRRQIRAFKAVSEVNSWMRAGAQQTAFHQMLTTRSDGTWSAVSTSVVVGGIKVDGLLRIDDRSLGLGYLLVSTNGSAAWITRRGKAKIVRHRHKLEMQQ